jgi:VIT1/CCC1 family predicted Fe2+/Mn2+ transporter
VDLLEAETSLEKARQAGTVTRSSQDAEDVGLSHFLVRFGEGEERVEQSRLVISAVAIGFSYLVGGVIPLLPYIFMRDVTHALFVSAGITGFVLIIFGIVKAYYTGSEIGWYGYTKGAIFTLAIGGAAAGSAYGISRGIESAWK